MNWKRGIICIGCILLFMAMVFQPGYRIIVSGSPLPGVYAPETALRCAEAATRAADEITRTAEDVPYQLIPVLCLRYTEVDETQLCHTLLNAYDGVVQVYTISKDGAPAVKFTYANTESH